MIDVAEGSKFMTTSMIISKGRTVFVGDIAVTERPDAEEMADIAVALAAKARQMGHTPRVAILSFTNFGNPESRTSVEARRAVDILQKSSGRNYATEITLPDNILSGKMHQGFSMALMQKDAGLALGMAAAMAQDMPLGASAFDALQDAINTHGDAADMSLVALSYEAKTGARIRPE